MRPYREIRLTKIVDIWMICDNMTSAQTTCIELLNRRRIKRRRYDTYNDLYVPQQFSAQQQQLVSEQTTSSVNNVTTIDTSNYRTVHTMHPTTGEHSVASSFANKQGALCSIGEQLPYRFPGILIEIEAYM